MGLAPLATAGRSIINQQTGHRVLLRGVNRSGLEYTEPDEDGFCSAAGISRHEIRYLARDWGANIIRLPFNQDFALRGRGGRPAEDYLRDLDRVIYWASTCGAYTLLDLQWIHADLPYGGERNFVPPLPNPESIELWRLLARRYRGETAVLFDLFNEPHDPLPDDPHPLLRPDGSPYLPTYRRVTMEDWQPWACLLIDTIRSENPEALIWVSGVNWGYDLRGFPIARPNLVYSTHVYPGKGAHWQEAFGALASLAPVFAAEWGGQQPDLEWGRRLVRYFDELGIGWCAWSWADWPHLVTRYAPTPFGELVRSELRRGA